MQHTKVETKNHMDLQLVPNNQNLKKEIKNQNNLKNSDKVREIGNRWRLLKLNTVIQMVLQLQIGNSVPL